MSEFACRKHGYHDETKTHSCPDCYADWLAAKPKALPYRGYRGYRGDNEIFGTPDADDWYEWEGDDMIRPAGMVEIQLRCGIRNEGPAESWEWSISRTPHSGDIVKWRPAQ